MKKLIRMFALVLALITVTGMFAACANTNDPEVSTEAPTTNAPVESGDVTEEETLYVPDDLDEKYNFGETITIFMWDDWRMTEFYAEESGDIIDDAIYRRNLAVETRLDITLEFVEAPGDSGEYTSWIQQAENDWFADNEYDIYAGYSRTVPLLAIKKMTANLLEQSAFNADKPWWPEALTTECTVKDQLYFCTGDIATSMLWYMVAFMYNKELYENHIQNGGKTPMDMVDDDEWTLQNFLSLVQDVYTDLDQSGTKNEHDFYGACIFSTDIDSFMIGAGITSLEKDEDGGLRISEKWNSQRCADICETVGTAMRLQGIFCDADVVRPVFRDSRAIFLMDRVFNIPGIDNGNGIPLEFSVGVVPVPKFDESQVDYKTNLGNPFTIYAINVQSRSLEATVTTLEAMASDSYRRVTPAVFEVAMKVRYTDDPQTSAMFDILKENVSFDVGKLYYYSIKNCSQVFSNTCLSSTPSGFLSALSRNKRIIESNLKAIMKLYNE